ncbi:hypothetical protein SFUMM280S_08777 [Streptomyces fumanus]
MPETPNDFGSELRRRRMAARLSLQQLAQRVHYSKSQLSKVERGLKRPTPELARLCDTVLRADGALSRLAETAQPSRAPLPVSSHSDDEVWLMHLPRTVPRVPARDAPGPDHGRHRVRTGRAGR